MKGAEKPTHGAGGKEMSEGRKQRKKGGIYGVKEGESATGSFSASYRWPPASAFRRRGIPGKGEGREGRCQEGGRHRTRRVGHTCGLLSNGTATWERKSTGMNRLRLGFSKSHTVRYLGASEVALWGWQDTIWTLKRFAFINLSRSFLGETNLRHVG